MPAHDVSTSRRRCAKGEINSSRLISLWSTSEGRVAVIVGVACWAQLGLAPAVAQRPTFTAAAVALGALFALLAGASGFPRRAPPPTLLATAGFFGLCGFEAALLGASPVPRLDAPARVLAAISAVAYIALVARAVSARAPGLPGSLTLLPDVAARDGGPGLRNFAMVCVAIVVFGCAVLAPARLGSVALFAGGTGRGAEALLRGRAAMTSAGGVALGIMVAITAGSSVLRGVAPRPRRASRALTYGVWAGVAWAMRFWLDRAR